MGPIIYLFGQADGYANYIRAAENAGGRIRCTLHPEDASGCDALLLPGGGDIEPWRYGQENTASRNLDPERDQTELRLLDRFTQAGKPVLGICRGMQVINVFFGGTLFQDLPGHSQKAGADRIHAVHTALSFLAAWPGNTVNSAHHQAVDRLGRGLRAVQWAPDGVTEAFVHETLPVWGVQWHPERFPGGERVFRRFLEQSACMQSL